MTSDPDKMAYYELLAHYRLMVQAKFSWCIQDIFRGSPFIANIINHLYQQIIDTEHVVGSTQFRDADRHIKPDSDMWRSCIAFAHSENWRTIAHDLKREHIRNIHSPYNIEDDILEKVIAEVDALDEEQPELDYQINIVYSDYFGNYFAYLPELDDCFAKGDTPEDALANLKVVKEKWIAQAKQENRPIYKPYFSPSWHRYRFSEE